MIAVQHEILSSRSSGMTPKRAMIIGGVGLLHVAAIWGLMNGMVARALEIVRPPIIVTVEPKTQPKLVVPVLQPKLLQPAEQVRATVPIPIIDVANNEPDRISLPPAQPTNPLPPAVDTAATGVGSTHTIPPYPLQARTLVHQGTVVLQLTVSAAGDVTAATVATSSGYPELDQAAVAWVVGHWKYKPALQAGLAIPSQTQAAVKFDLKQARL